MFAAHIADADCRYRGVRRFERVPVSFTATLRRDGGEALVCLAQDLSRGGVRLTPEHGEVSKGAVVTIVLPLLQPLRARVAWVKEARVGLQFRHPLSEDELRLIVGRFGSPASVGDEVK
jgi:hypothetical protein